MKKYISKNLKKSIENNIVQAELMTRDEAITNNFLDASCYSYRENFDGYGIEFKDGQKDFLPKENFERSFLLIDEDSEMVLMTDVLDNMKEVDSKTIEVFGKPMTIVTVRMNNGFLLTETSTCVNPENYSEEVGVKSCLDKIQDKIWALLGYALQERKSNRQKIEGILKK